MEIVILSTLVIGLTQVFKQTLGITKRYIPIVALFTSLMMTYVFAYYQAIPVTWEMLLNGLSIGLGSVGLWETGKSILSK